MLDFPILLLLLRVFQVSALLTATSVLVLSTQDPRYFLSTVSPWMWNYGWSFMVSAKYLVLRPFSQRPTFLHLISTLRESSWACSIAPDRKAISSAKFKSARTSFRCFLDLQGVLVNPISSCYPSAIALLMPYLSTNMKRNRARVSPLSNLAFMSNWSVFPSGVYILALVFEYLFPLLSVDWMGYNRP